MLIPATQAPCIAVAGNDTRLEPQGLTGSWSVTVQRVALELLLPCTSMEQGDPRSFYDLSAHHPITGRLGVRAVPVQVLDTFGPSGTLSSSLKTTWPKPEALEHPCQQYENRSRNQAQ